MTSKVEDDATKVETHSYSLILEKKYTYTMLLSYSLRSVCKQCVICTELWIGLLKVGLPDEADNRESLVMNENRSIWLIFMESTEF